MEPLVHYVIPTLVILVLNPGIDRRRVLKYSPLALLPDIDFFFGHTFFHNIFIPLGVSSVVYHLAKRDRTAWKLSLYFLYAHLILDLGFVALFYPIRDSVISLNVKIYTSPLVGVRIWNMLTGGGGVQEGVKEAVKSDFGIVEYPLEAAKTSEVAPLFTQLGLMLILLFLLAFAFKHELGEKKGDGK